MDCTYKIVPPGIKGYKFLVIVSYASLKDKLNLILFALMLHENKENIEAVFNFLKIKFDFNPNYITTDYHKGKLMLTILLFMIQK